MANDEFSYSIANLPDGKINAGTLAAEIHQNAVVTVTCENVGVFGGSVLGGGVILGGQVTLTFQAELTQAMKTELDGGTTMGAEDPPISGSLLANHDNSATESAPYLDTDDVQLVRQHPQGPDHLLVNRDILFRTCVYEDGSSFEDKRMDTSTNKEADWDEVKHVGVYKDVSGTMTQCDDQADADANGILSVWEYYAKDLSDGSSPILWETAGGKLYVDPDLPANEEWDHRFYAVGGPAIPYSMGGSIPFFDGYLQRFAGKELECCSDTVKVLDPNTAAGVAGATIRFYFVHPAGSKHEHVLRFVTYRPPKK